MGYLGSILHPTKGLEKWDAEVGKAFGVLAVVAQRNKNEFFTGFVWSNTEGQEPPMTAKPKKKRSKVVLELPPPNEGAKNDVSFVAGAKNCVADGGSMEETSNGSSTSNLSPPTPPLINQETTGNLTPGLRPTNLFNTFETPVPQN